MAEAGFYYSGQNSNDDSAACFVCGKVLDGWEKTDQPWSEHEKHAPNCQFVRIHQAQDDLTVRHQLIENELDFNNKHLRLNNF